MEYWLKELQESLDRYTSCRGISEILLKMELSSIQSITANASNLKHFPFRAEFDPRAIIWTLLVEAY